MASHPQAPLHDPEAEQCVLGSMLLDREGIPDLLEAVGAEDFHDPRHARVFEAVLALYDRSDSIDFVTVGEELSRRGLLEGVGCREYLIQLSRVVPTTAHAIPPQAMRASIRDPAAAAATPSAAITRRRTDRRRESSAADRFSRSAHASPAAAIVATTG